MQNEQQMNAIRNNKPNNREQNNNNKQQQASAIESGKCKKEEE